MLSELCMDGIVVDLGHEMTQIVPIFNGMVDMRKVNTFPVGGITMDVILMNMWRED
jgi:actin-related protein